jgi:hypothetical protein
MFKANWREYSAGIPKQMTTTRLRAAIDCEGFVNTALIQAGINGIAAQNPRICPANMLEAKKRGPEGALVAVAMSDFSPSSSPLSRRQPPGARGA